MTERWRKKLEGIDQVGPGDDVYQRAKDGPTLPEPQSPMQRTSTRIVTVIAAFVVFALAISVFAIPALRLGREAQPLSGGQLSPLWPIQSVDGIQALQARADSGEASWALDPQQVAARFGQTVLGWPHAWAGESDAPELSCGVVPGDYPATAAPTLCAVQSLAPVARSTSGICEPGLACADYGGLTTGPPSPFREFQVLHCAPEDRCEPTFDGESVTLFQPAGSTDGGIWAVLEASSAYLRLSVVPGAIVRDADTLTALSAVPDESRATLGYGTHSGPCPASDSTSAFKSAGSEVADLLPNAGFLAASDAQLDVHLTGTDASCDASPGYVFSAIRGDGSGTEPLQDPIAGARNDQVLAAFSAAPVTFEWPEEIASSTTRPSGGSTELAWTAYADALGWTIDVPVSWDSVGFDGTPEVPGYAHGASFFSGSPSVTPGGGFSASPREGQVMVRIWHDDRDSSIADDSTFPLSMNEFHPDPGTGDTGQIQFRADGLAFKIDITYATGADVTALSPLVEHMVASIRFAPWQFEEMRNGWTAVAPGGPELRSASAEWLQDKLTGDHYLASMTSKGARVLFGPAPACAGGDGRYEVRETYVGGITCPDGSGGDWDLGTGQPRPSNSPTFAVTLDASDAVVSWDGWLLARLVPTPSPTG